MQLYFSNFINYDLSVHVLKIDFFFMFNVLLTVIVIFILLHLVQMFDFSPEAEVWETNCKSEEVRIRAQYSQVQTFIHSKCVCVCE